MRRVVFLPSLPGLLRGQNKPALTRSFHATSRTEKKRHGRFSVDRSSLVNDHLSMKSQEELLRGKETPSPLAKDLISYIQMKGPITLHDYMAQAANHALHGYYQSSAEKIGERGDFITAPELSQLFGEILGVWVLLTWRAMGSPSSLNLVELGPGRGTLMEDILRVGRKYDDFRRAMSVHFVELSRDLRKKQLARLRGDGQEGDVPKTINDGQSFVVKGDIRLTWHSLLHQVPTDFPTIIIGQEFLDAFPVHQFVYTDNGWREKLVDIDDSPNNTKIFRYVLSPAPTPAVRSLLRIAPVQSPVILTDAPKTQRSSSDSLLLPAKVGDGIEISPLTLSTCEDIAKRVVSSKGAAILIDYGEDFTQEDSLRGFKDHKQLNVLSQPGLVDITADVDFASCRRSAESKGAAVLPLLTQGQFLMNMGIVQRVEELINADHVSDEEATQLFESMKMLVLPEAMGTKFKVMLMSHPELKNVVPGHAQQS